MNEEQVAQELSRLGLDGGYTDGMWVNAGKLAAASAVALASICTRNYDKPRVCHICGRSYDYPDQGWQGYVASPGYHSANDTCLECGFRSMKAAHRIPEAYFDACLSDFPAFSPEDCDEFVGRDLWVYGPIGSGKTHFAYALMNRLLANGVRGVSFVEFHTLTRSLRGAYRGPDWLSEDQILMRWVGAKILFVDDVFGTRHEEKPSDDENHALYELVRHRYSERKRTYFTSNYCPADLQSKGFNARTISRIRERCLEIPLTGTDYRSSSKVTGYFDPSQNQTKNYKEAE